MYGRYGLDELGRFLTRCLLGILVLNIFVQSSIFFYLEIILISYMYFRMLSKDYGKREKENRRFLDIKYQFMRWMGSNRRKMEDRKYNHIYICTSCKQKIRIPRGKGKIEITCPKCYTKFIKKS